MPKKLIHVQVYRTSWAYYLVPMVPLSIYWQDTDGFVRKNFI